MRTTLDIDKDIMIAVKERARRDGVSAGKMATLLLRGALTNNRLNQSDTIDDSIFEYKNGVPVLKSRGELISAEHLQKLIDEDDLFQ